MDHDSLATLLRLMSSTTVHDIERRCVSLALESMLQYVMSFVAGSGKTAAFLVPILSQIYAAGPPNIAEDKDSVSLKIEAEVTIKALCLLLPVCHC